MTCRENKSRTTATYSQPSYVRIIVISVTRRHNRGCSAFKAFRPLVSDLCLNAVLARNPFHPAFATSLTQLPQIIMNLAIPVHTTALQPGLPDQPQQTPVLDGAG
jgi:hypothetical protein